MSTPLLNLTIEQLDTAARDYAEKYDDRFKKIAKNAFMEGLIYAQKIDQRQHIAY